MLDPAAAKPVNDRSISTNSVFIQPHRPSATLTKHYQGIHARWSSVAFILDHVFFRATVQLKLMVLLALPFFFAHTRRV